MSIDTNINLKEIIRRDSFEYHLANIVDGPQDYIFGECGYPKEFDLIKDDLSEEDWDELIQFARDIAYEMADDISRVLRSHFSYEDDDDETETDDEDEDVTA